MQFLTVAGERVCMDAKNRKVGKQLPLTRKIKAAIAELIDSGAHQNIAKTTQAIGMGLGLNERLLNYTHVEIRNKLNEIRFRAVPPKKRALFVPQCIRDSEKCKAKMGEWGWECASCGRCQVPKIKKLADEFKYGGLYIVPGGSMVYKIINEKKYKGVLGVSCFAEMQMAMNALRGGKIAPQGVLLLREGCKDTSVNLEELREKLLLK